MNVKRLTVLAVLTAAALAIYVIEAQIPPLAPIPGIKLGLANVITLWALWQLGPRDSALILLARILLGSLFGGSAAALIYSLAGGAACFLCSWAVKKALTEKQIWVMGVIGAIAHNAGQLIAASAVMKSAYVWAYAPVLGASGIVTGVFTGLIAGLIYKRMKDAKVLKGI